MRVASKEAFIGHLKEKKIALTSYYSRVSKLGVFCYFTTILAIGLFFYTKYDAVSSLSSTILWVVACSFSAFLASKKLETISNNCAFIEDNNLIEDDFTDHYTKIVDDICEVFLYLTLTTLLVVATFVSLIMAIWG